MLRRLVPAALVLAAALQGQELRDAATPAAIVRKPAGEARFLVVNVWATWCAPCVHEMPALRAISDRYASRGVDFAGVSMDDVLPGDRAATKTKVSAFLRKQAIRYRNYYYTGKQDDLATAFAFEGELPVTFVFDRRGREVMRVQGAIAADRFDQQLRDLVEK